MNNTKELLMHWSLVSLDEEKQTILINYDAFEELVNEDLFNLLKEFYYVTAYERIYETIYEDRKQRLEKLTFLDLLDDYYCKILDIKKFFYSQLIHNLNNLAQSNSKKISLNNNDFNDFLLGLHNIIFNLTFKSSPDLDRFLDSISVMTLGDFDRLGVVYPSYIYSLLRKIIKHLYYQEFNISTFHLFFELILKLNRRYSDPFFKKLYLSVLTLLIYYYFPMEKNSDTDLINIKNVPTMEDLDKIEHVICRYTMFFDSAFIKLQSDYQMNLLTCYISNPLPQEKFNNKIEQLYNALSKDKKLTDRYIAGRSCYAVMNVDGERYATISGFSNNHLQLLSKLLGNNTSYKIVPVNSEIRYYYNSEEFFKYLDIPQDYKEDSSVKRMFSCCERKLLTVLYKRKHVKSYRIFVKKEPCVMCDRAIRAFDISLGKKPVISYPDQKNLMEHQLNLSNYDWIVEMVLNNKKEQ